ncbi:aminocarboxymuconate-semialdehyde decarboxylase [Micromonospora pisi]|uniref:Aminocarboxymuconate-semialdehyde decarboxylase n=2 Tax=Micromonospora pisi TaxID=589240 RepID=A0A495JU74_9ACTN|nr:aminocarboxymuconate-semialdehyde decarboxylase [Micromonospora pisi]
MPRTLGQVEEMISAKLACGVRATIIGSPVGGGAMVPLPGVDNYAQSEDDLARHDAWLAGLVDRYPERLRAYVYVNPFGGAAHLHRVAQTVRQPQFVGLIANTSVAGRYLDAPEAEDFFALAAEVDLPVLLHPPAKPAAGAGLENLLLIEQLGRFGDVTIGLACCVLGGWLDRFPGLKLIGPTAGGALGLLVEKLDRIMRPTHWDGAPAPPQGPSPQQDRPAAGTARSAMGPPRLMRRLAALAAPPSSYLPRIWVDTATPSANAVDLALRIFGPDRVLFGTDSPPLPHSESGATLDLLDRLGVTGAVRDGIGEGNALALFGDRLPPAPRDAVASGR